MKILHLTDTHLGAWWSVEGAPPDWSRAHDHHQAFCQTLALADEHDVDLVVHTGDVFDRSAPPARWVQAAARALAAAARRRPVVVMGGNHDRHGLRRLLPLHMPDLHVLDRPHHLRFGGLRLGAVPYRRDARAWAHGAREAVAGGVDVLLAHQAFDGAWAPGITFRVGVQGDTVGAAHLPAGVGIVLCGHIHPRQTLHLAGVPVVHPGPTAHTSFGDRDLPVGVTLWHDGARRFLDLPSRPLRVVGTHADAASMGPGELARIRVVGPAGAPRPRPRDDRSQQLGLFSRRAA